MSIRTAFLGLFKWNTSDDEDLNSNFDIDTAMNDNWDTIDEAVSNLDGNKVDKVAGKGLSEEDYTSTEKTKLQTSDADQNGTLIERAMAKYDYIAGKYHLTNFITSRTPQAFSTRFVSLEIKENKILLAVIIAGILSATSIGLYLYIKKKKTR